MDINYDLELQLVEYLNNNFNLAWFKLLQLDKDLYLAYLYNLRKNRYILTANEVKKLKQYIVKLPKGLNSINKQIISAAESGHLYLIKYLVSQGGNIHVLSETDRVKIAGNGYLDIVKYLVQHGANIHAKNNRAFRFAAANGHLDVVQEFEEFKLTTQSVA